MKTEKPSVLYVEMEPQLKHAFHLYCVSARQNMSDVIRDTIKYILEELGFPENPVEFEENLRELIKINNPKKEGEKNEQL